MRPSSPSDVVELIPQTEFRVDDLRADIPDEQAAKSKTRTMSKSIINLVLDALLLVAAVFLLWVSVVMRMVFPAPTKADGWVLWGLSFDRWHDVQFTTLCVVALLALEHLVLHWSWVCGIISTKILRMKNRPDEANQAVYGVATFIALLLTQLAGLVAATLAVKRSTM
ncbi:MAG: hypothetical protein NT013_10455 [Planctomycetia bacterium]|nr:hypothetical protein [Planctomycetia bacterium]